MCEHDIVQIQGQVWCLTHRKRSVWSVRGNDGNDGGGSDGTDTPPTPRMGSDEEQS